MPYRIIRIVPILACMAATACGASMTKPVVEAHRHRQLRIKSQAIAKMVSPRCDNGDALPDHAKYHAPAQHFMVTTDDKVQQRCGMVAVEVTEPVFAARFVTELCGGQDDASCRSRFFSMAVARMGTRYSFADWLRVRQRCEGRPLECRSLVTLERWAMISHNDGVATWTDNAMADERERFQAEYDRAFVAEQDRRRTNNAVMHSISNALNPPDVSCTTSSSGGVSTTSCSRPRKR